MNKFNKFLTFSAVVAFSVVGHTVVAEKASAEAKAQPTGDSLKIAQTNVCRIVNTSKNYPGLNIRSQPNGSKIGFVANGQKVTLTTGTVKTVGGRTWLEISGPKKGWVTNGPVGSKGSNLINCR